LEALGSKLRQLEEHFKTASLSPFIQEVGPNSVS